MMESIAQQAAKDARDVFSDDRQAQAAIGYMEQLIYAALRNVEYDLSDPVTVHANMLRGTIAKPTVEQIVHLYGREAFQPMIDVAIEKALEKACLAVSEHADWPEDEHGRTEQVRLFARVINAIRAITPALSLAPTDAAHVNETSKSEHDAGNMLTAAQAPAEDAHVKGETAGQMLERLGMDGVKWAAEFRTTALRLGYSDMDEGWLIGWFCNAIMAGYDRSAAQAREAALHPDDMLPEAIRLIRQEASRDHSQDVVTGLKHIALLLEQLIGEART